MPSYTFESDDGERFVWTCSVADKPEVIERDGKKFTHNIVADHNEFIRSGAKWPMTSNSLLVSKQDVVSDREKYARHGVTVDYKAVEGGLGYVPVFTSQAQQNAALKAKGLVNYDRYY